MVEASTGAGAVLRLIRGGATTRTQLALTTGLSRSTLAERVHALLVLGLVTETNGASTGGRPPATLEFNPTAGVVLATSVYSNFCRVAVCDLDAKPLIEHTVALAQDAPAAPVRARRGARGARARGRRARARVGDRRRPGRGAGRSCPFDPRRRAGARGPAREPARPRRAVDPLARGRPPALRIRRREHRMRHRLPRQGPSRSARGRRRTRPHPRARVRGRALHVREHGLPRGRRRRTGAGRAADGRGAAAPTRPRTSPRWRAAEPDRPCTPCGRPGARSARCSPSA